jgi:hypothetical protein
MQSSRLFIRLVRFAGFSIEGPSQARIECNDNGDGSAHVRYWPTVPGEYAVHILCNDEDIPLSPFMAWIEAPGNFNPNMVIDSERVADRLLNRPLSAAGQGIWAWFGAVGTNDW